MPRPPRVDPVVYIGAKPTMTYVFEVVGQLNSGIKDVMVRARGNAIARAVDVAEVVRRHHLLDSTVEVKGVRIGTERLTNKDGRETNVSSIEITLSKVAAPASTAPPAKPPTAGPAPPPAPPAVPGSAPPASPPSGRPASGGAGSTP